MLVYEKAGSLTNFEVKELLKSQQAARAAEEAALPLPGARRGQAGSGTAWSSQQAAAGVSEQVLTYLDRACPSQSRAQIAAFQREARPLIERARLTRMECLALVNTPPCSVVEVHLIVEECEERLSPEDVKALVELCKRLLLLPQQPALGVGKAAAAEPTAFEGSAFEPADDPYAPVNAFTGMAT